MTLVMSLIDWPELFFYVFFYFFILSFNIELIRNWTLNFISICFLWGYLGRGYDKLTWLTFLGFFYWFCFSFLFFNIWLIAN